jgi:multidrug efflux pump subunit AcrA (membrane-fusion protein)
MKVWWFTIAALVLIGVAVAGYAVIGPGFAKAQPVQYLSSDAAVANVVAQVVVTGTVEPAQTDTLTFGSPPSAQPTLPSSSGNSSAAAANSPVSGLSWTVTDVSVAVGDHVTAGESLATADTASINAQIAVAKAQVSADQTKVNNGGSTLTVANAKEALLVAKTNLANLEAAKANASLVAPEDGVVTAVNVTKGSVAPSGAAIVMVSDAMVASGTVTESDVSTISIGQKATVTLSAFGTDVAGTVSYVSRAGTSSSGVVGFGILVALDSVPDNTRPGMSANVTIVTNEVDGVLAVPSIALNGTVGSYTVTVLASDGTTTVQQVGVGLVTSDLAQITSGLTAGQAVVTGTASTQLTTTNNGAGGGGFRFGGGGFGGGGFPGGGN